jgi:hypothetical protein
VTRPREACPHSLPTSNGWSSSWRADSGTDGPRVYCGRCKDDIDASTDTEWAARYEKATGSNPLVDVVKIHG